MEIIIGIGIGIVVSALVNAAKKRESTKPLTREQQELVEQVAIIQPIIQDIIKK